MAALASEYTMYGLMFVLPLVGWGMLSAAHYPVVLFGSVHLPFILPHDALLHATLRKAHTVLAYLLFLTVLAHFGAILFHTLIVRDGMLLRMVPWDVRPREVVRQRSTYATEASGHPAGWLRRHRRTTLHPIFSGRARRDGARSELRGAKVWDRPMANLRRTATRASSERTASCSACPCGISPTRTSSSN